MTDGQTNPYPEAKTMTKTLNRDRKSPGHLAFVGDFEWYDHDGHIIRANRANGVDLEGRRHGRIESYPESRKAGEALLAQAIAFEKE